MKPISNILPWRALVLALAGVVSIPCMAQTSSAPSGHEECEPGCRTIQEIEVPVEQSFSKKVANGTVITDDMINSTLAGCVTYLPGVRELRHTNCDKERVPVVPQVEPVGKPEFKRKRVDFPYTVGGDPPKKPKRSDLPILVSQRFKLTAEGCDGNRYHRFQTINLEITGPGGGSRPEEDPPFPPWAGGDGEEESGPCPTEPFTPEELDSFEHPDTRAQPDLGEPEAVEIIAENISFTHRKRGFLAYNQRSRELEDDEVELRYLAESIESQLEGGNPESPVGGSMMRIMSKWTGQIAIVAQTGQTSYLSSYSANDSDASETEFSASFPIITYDDCPNEKEDQPATMNVTGTLSGENTTDQVLEDTFNTAWDFKGYYERETPEAVFDVWNHETGVDYQKTEYKIRVPADLPRPYRVSWVVEFTPEDEDLDDDEAPEPEYELKHENITGEESSVHEIDPRNPDEQGTWRVYLLHADLDVDSDNNNAQGDPDRSEEEEIAQRHPGAVSPDQPGKMLFVHGGDEDYDGIPDFADGFSDIFQTKGIPVGGAPDDQGRLGEAGFVPQGAGLIPIAYDVSPGAIPESDIVIKFEYPESDPGAVRHELEEGSRRSVYKLPEQGSLRLWARNCDGADLRSVRSISEGGHFIPDGEEFKLEDFRRYLSEAGGGGIFVESVRASERIRDQSVKLHVGIATGGATDWAYEEEVHFTSLDMALMAIGEGGGTSRAQGIGVSHSSPVVKLTTCEVSEPRFDYSRGEWVVDIDLAGTIKSKYLDTIPEAQGGVIREAFVHINASDEPVETLAVTVQKGRNLQDLARPFPYQGSFSKKLVGIPAVDGVNVVTVRTQDRTFQIDGVVEAAYTMDLPETVPPYEPADPDNPGDGDAPPPGTGSSTLQTTLTYRLRLLDGLSPELVNHAVFTTTSSASPASSEVLALTETAADSLLFADTAAAVSLRLPPDFSPSPERVDRAVITIEDVGGQEISSILLGETGENTNEYVAFISSWTVVWGTGAGTGEEVQVVTTSPVVVYQTDGGEFHPYAYQIHGPKALVESFTELKFTDGVGETEETGGGSASHSFTADLAEAENKHFLANKIEPQAVAVVAFRENIEEDRFPGISDQLYLNISRLQNQSLYPQNWGEFSKGFGMGLVKGGIDMVGGLGDAAKMGCKAVYKGGQSIVRGGVFALKCIWKTATGQSLQEEVRQVQEAKAKLNKRLEFFDELKNQGPMVVESILKGDFKKLDNLSGSMRTMVSFGAEIFGALVDQLLNDDDYKRGIFWGRATFEIGSAFFPLAKVGAVGKVKFLEKLGTLKFFKEGPGGAAYAANQAFRAALTTTRMCFVGGTLVWAAHGNVPIEDIRPGDLVWSRAGSGGEPALKPVVATFRTHPEKLLELRCDHDGDGLPDETVTGTAQHPFWCGEARDFVPLGSLKPGQTLWLADGRTTAVLSVITQRGPPGERNTTYNFEVADHHTYFVTESGIWVHNQSTEAGCQRVFSIYQKLRDKAPEGHHPWDIFKNVVKKLDSASARVAEAGRGTGAIPSQIFHLAAGECMSNIVSAGKRFPSYREMSAVNGGHHVNWKKLSDQDQHAFKEYLGEMDIQAAEPNKNWFRIKLEVHHGVPKSISRHLGIPESAWDDTPAFLTTMQNHRVGLESLHGCMVANGIDLKNLGRFAPNDPTKVQELKDLLKKSYDDAGIGDLWSGCAAFLTANGK